MRIPNEVSHLGNNSDEYQWTVTLRIYQICEQMMCYPVIVVHDQWFRSYTITSLSSPVPIKWTVLKCRQSYCVLGTAMVDVTRHNWSLICTVFCTEDSFMLPSVAISCHQLPSVAIWINNITGSSQTAAGVVSMIPDISYDYQVSLSWPPSDIS